MKRDVDDDTKFELVEATFRSYWSKYLGDCYPSGDKYLANLCTFLLSFRDFEERFEKNFLFYEKKLGVSKERLLSAPRRFLEAFNDFEPYRARLLLRDRKARQLGGIKLLKKYLSDQSLKNFFLFEHHLLILLVLLVRGSFLERVYISRQEVWFADDFSSITHGDDKDEEDGGD